MAPDQPPPPASVVLVAQAPSVPSWALLDPYTARHTRIISFGLVGFRLLSERTPSVGYTAALGDAVTTVRGAFLAGGMRETELRFVPHDSFALVLSRYQWEGGLRLGPLEPVARVGFTTVNLDYGHAGVTFGMFSPRVGAGIWLKLSQSRLGITVFSEYYWRWLGGESAFVHGIALELQPLGAPLVVRSTSSPSPSPPGRR